MKNIAFIGMGGVGGYFGGKISQLLKQGEADVNIYFVARGEHLQAIRENGLRLKTKTDGELICRPSLATDQWEELPLLDICFLCVKSYDLENAVRNLLPKIKEETRIIPLLNGVDIYDRIRTITEKGIVYPACVYIGTHVEAPGIVNQDGGACKIFFGSDVRKPEEKANEVCEIMKKAGIQHVWTERHMEEIWNKYIFIAAYGLVTASANKTLGEVYENSELSECVRGIMQEIWEIGCAQNIDLPKEVIDEAYQKATNFPYEAKTSFQRDYEKKDKPDERELFGGTILALGAKYNIATPYTALVYKKIQ